MTYQEAAGDCKSWIYNQPSAHYMLLNLQGLHTVHRCMYGHQGYGNSVTVSPEPFNDNCMANLIMIFLGENYVFKAQSFAVS